MFKLVPLWACAAALAACAPAKQTALAKRPATSARPSTPAHADQAATPVDQLPPAVQSVANARRNGSTIKASRVRTSSHGRVFSVRMRDGRELDIADDGTFIKERPETPDAEANDDARHP